MYLNDVLMRTIKHPTVNHIVAKEERKLMQVRQQEGGCPLCLKLNNSYFSKIYINSQRYL